jgi:hypothetical protein
LEGALAGRIPSVRLMGVYVILKKPNPYSNVHWQTALFMHDPETKAEIASIGLHVVHET